MREIDKLHTVGLINFEDKKFRGFRGYLLNLEIKGTYYSMKRNACSVRYYSTEWPAKMLVTVSFIPQYIF